MKKSSVWLAILVLIISVLLPTVWVANASAVTDADLANAIKLGDNTTIDETFNETGVKWFKYKPTASDIKKHSHVKLTLKSDYILNVTMFSSAEKAQNNEAYEQYVAGTVENGKAIIKFPYAWDETYYIKVEYSGFMDDGSMAGEPATEDGVTDEEMQVPTVAYTLTAQPVTLAPATELSSGNACPVELGVDGKKDAKTMLSDIRVFRDGILSKTADGRELSALYYKAAPFLAAKLLTDSSLKQTVYKHLVTIQPLVKDMNKNGAASTRVITKSEAQAIQALFDITFNNVPATLQQKMTTAAKKVGLTDGLAGEDLADVVKQATGELTKKSSKNKFIVKLKDGYSFSKFKQQATGKTTASTLAVKNNEILEDTYVIELEPQDASMSMKAQQATTAKTATQIEKMAAVEYVEPVTTYHALAADIQYPYQWSLQNTGSEGITGADVSNVRLQKLVNATALKTTTIAVVDTGVDNTLADLKNVVLMNKGRNYVDRQQTALDDNGHGTHVSGIIAAQATNGYSMRGINQHTKILPVKVLDESGSGSLESVALGIKYAVDQGAKVINLSLGGSYSRTIEAALKYAHAKNVAIIVASGNDGAEGISYPGSSRYVISVGATSPLDVVSDYSNYSHKLDLVAPGSNIPSLVPNGNVTYMSGTSMATPHVAAVVGLLKSTNPSMKIGQIRTVLHESSKNVAFEERDNDGTSSDDDILNLIGGSEDYDDYEEEATYKLAVGKDLVSGYGRLNGFNALSTAVLKTDIAKTTKPTVLSGKALAGSKIVVKKGSKVLATKKVPSNGKFNIKLAKQKNKQKLTVVVTNKATTAKAVLAVYVKK